jgi:hypothetical protein
MRGARLLLAAAAVVAALWIALVRAGPPLVSRWLTRASGLTVEVDRIGVLGFVADGVRVRMSPGVAPFLEVERVRLAGAVRVLVRGGGAIARIDLVHPTLRLRRNGDGRLLPAWSSRWPSLPGGLLSIARARVIGGRVVVGPRVVTIPRLDLADVTLQAAPGERVVVQARLAAAGGTGTVEGRLGSGDAALTLDARGVEARRLPPLRGGRVSGRVHYTWEAGRTHAVQGDLRAHGVRFATAAGNARVGAARLTGVDADMRASSLRVRRTVLDDARLASLRLRAVAHELAWPGESGVVLASGRIGRGGRLRARGTIDPARGAVDGRAKVSGAALAGLVPPAGRLRVVDGTLGATASLTGPPLVLRDARVLVDGFRAVVADDGGEQPLLAWQHLEADAARVDVLPLRIRLRRVAVESPSLSVLRDARGFLPKSVVEEVMALPRVRAALTVPAHAETPADDAEVTATIEDGTIALEDRVLQPAVTTSLRGVQATLRERPGPPRAAELALDARVNGVAPMAVKASIDGPALAVSAEVSALPLPAVAGYLRPTGYVARDGTVEVKADVHFGGGKLDGPVQVVLAGAVLERADGADVLAEATGLPGPTALALVRDVDGRITLVGDAARPTVLRDAIADAVARPLVEGDPVAIEFPPGVAAPDAAGEETADRLAVLMRRRESLLATVRGRSGPADGDAAAALAAARAEWLRARLCDGRGVAAARVRTEAALVGEPGVVVEVGP